MDLGAYAHIGELGKIAKENGIEVPRLRGYRLMKDEEPIAKKEIEEMKQSVAIECVEDLCRSRPFWNQNSYCSTYSSWTDYLCDYLLTSVDFNDKIRYRPRTCYCRLWCCRKR